MSIVHMALIDLSVQLPSACRPLESEAGSNVAPCSEAFMPKMAGLGNSVFVHVFVYALFRGRKH